MNARQQYLYWYEGWLHLSNRPYHGGICLWKIPDVGHEGPLDREAVSKIGGRFIARRPDRMDCQDIAHGLLSRILRDAPDARIVGVPPERALLSGGHVIFIEGHHAVFFWGYRIPITNAGVGMIPHAVGLCARREGDPRWLTMWRCHHCGGYVFMMPGKGRRVEYFTETIRKDFSHIYETLDLPDEFLAQTCIDCGCVQITAADAEVVKQWEESRGKSG